MIRYNFVFGEERENGQKQISKETMAKTFVSETDETLCSQSSQTPNKIIQRKHVGTS